MIGGRVNAYRMLQRAGVPLLLRAVYRIEVSGRDRIPTDGACILAANHESLLDPFILGTCTTRTIRFVTKSELFRSRFLAATLRSLGAISLSRGVGDVRAMGEARAALKRGDVVGIFPQGTCLPYRHRLRILVADPIRVAPQRPTMPAARELTARLEQAIADLRSPYGEPAHAWIAT